MATPDTLLELLTAPGPSGYETAPAAVFRDASSAFAEVVTDVMGSVWARVPGTAGGPTLAIVGHIDEIGVIVSHIDDDGFLRFRGVGGWDPQILVGQRVVLGTREGEIPGVVGKKPIHLLKEEERKQVPELRNLHIDIGALDGDDEVLVGARRVEDDLRRRGLRAQRAAQRDAVVATQSPVEEHDVGAGPAQGGQQLMAVAGGANAHESGLGPQHRLQPRPQDGVVVDDEYPNHAPRMVAGNGTPRATASPRWALSII